MPTDNIFKRMGSTISTKIDTVKSELQVEIANINKTSLGLGNVDNTSDLNKPISTATQVALNAKQNADPNLVSDPNYVHTDNNFTTLEKNKLAGITGGAGTAATTTVDTTNFGANVLNNSTNTVQSSLAAIDAALGDIDAVLTQILGG